jgi:peptidoglycan/LPS O-acetylase OafA/YrhL
MFLISRFFRLYPVYWASVIVAYIAASGSPDLVLYIVNLTMLQEFVGFKPVLGVYWTLTVELVFYASCILLFWAGLLQKPTKLLWVFGLLATYILLATSFRFATDISLPYGWPMFLALFFGGIAMRQYDDTGAARDRRFWSTVTICLVVSLIAAIAIYHDPQRYQKTWYAEFAATAGAVLLFVSITQYKPPLKFLSGIGVISYSVYLFHAPIGTWIISMLDDFGGLRSLPWEASLLLLIAGATGFSAITYNVFEKPGIKIGRKLQARVQDRLLTQTA